MLDYRGDRRTAAKSDRDADNFPLHLSWKSQLSCEENIFDIN